MKTIETDAVARSRRRALGVALACASAILGSSSCGKPFQENVMVAPADVRGTVGGLVIDAVSGDPIAGAAITVYGGASLANATSGPDGVFVAGADDDDADTLAELPAGGTLHVEVEGPATGTPYTGAELSAVLPVAAGDVPLAAPSVAVGPIGLVPRTLSLMVQVVRDDGQAYQNVQVQATTAVGWVSFASGSPAGAGSWSSTELTSTAGIATFGDLPDVAALPAPLSDLITFTIPAQDLNGDGFPEFEGVVATRSARTLAAGLVLLTVASIDLPLTVVSSNVPSLVSSGAAGDSLPPVFEAIDAVRLVFNQPVDPATFALAVSDEDGNLIATTAMFATTNIVIGDPPGGSWLSGAEHNVVVHAVSLGSNPPRTYDGWGAFFTLGPVPGVTVAANRDPGDPGIIRLDFSEPVGAAIGTAWSLGGASCPVFVGVDLTGDALLDDTNETLGPDCNVTLTGNEVDPAGAAGISGFTTRAYFYAPSGMPGLGTAVPLELRFSRAASAGTVIRSATGMVVGDLMVTIP